MLISIISWQMSRWPILAACRMALDIFSSFLGCPFSHSFTLFTSPSRTSRITPSSCGEQPLVKLASAIYNSTPSLVHFVEKIIEKITIFGYDIYRPKNDWCIVFSSMNIIPLLLTLRRFFRVSIIIFILNFFFLI